MNKTRVKCIVCGNTDLPVLFEKDKAFPIGNFPVEKGYPCQFIPYNVQICQKCQTAQLKYEGNLDLIYGNNHARAYGSLRNEMDRLFVDFITESGETHFIEIGAGSGSLANELIIRTRGKYIVVDPSYWGETDHRVVVPKYVEEVDLSSFKIPNVIMSHVFEHFYEPSRILEILAASDIQNVYLNFPNLEYCIKEGVNYVLTPEHSFYISTTNLAYLFLKHGYIMKKIQYYNDYAVFFHFSKSSKIKADDNSIDESGFFGETKKDVRNFYNILNERIWKCKRVISAERKGMIPLYIFPCSIHPLFLFAFGLDCKIFNNVLDNNPHKIGKFLYGTNLECLSFNETIRTPERKIILLVGGQFNQEVKSKAEENPNNIVFSV